MVVVFPIVCVVAVFAATTGLLAAVLMLSLLYDGNIVGIFHIAVVVDVVVDKVAIDTNCSCLSSSLKEF